MSRLETTGSANKPTQVPKTTRKRSTSLVVVKCDIASGFSAKTTKTVKKHQREAHEMKPHNETTFNQSVSDSILDATVDVSAHGQTDSLKHKTSTDFYQEVSCKQQSTVMRKLQEDPLNVSRSLLETSLVKPEDLDDNNSQEGDSLLCRFKHVITAKQIYYDTEGKRKREEKEKEEEKKIKEDEKKKKDDEEEEKKKKAKADSKKEKMKRKWESRKLRKTGNSSATSTGMEIDDLTDEPEKKKNKTKVEPSNTSNPNADSKPKPPTTSTSTSNLPPPSTHPNYPQPTQHTHPTKPPPSVGHFQTPQIPTSFNFNQGPRLHNTMTMERARQEEAQAQALTRRARLDSIRTVIASLQTRIIASQSQPQGTVDIQALIQQEAALKQHLFEQSY